MYNVIEMKDLTDEELMFVFKGGNNNAFDMLFDKYRNRIFRYVCYVYNLFGWNRDISEDIVQEVFIKNELRKVVEQIAGELPVKYKEVFVLHELNGLPYDEIAGILGANENTIRTHFHRARNLLKEKIRPYLED